MLAAGLPIVCEPVEAKRRPGSVVDAQFSLPFGIALALVQGRAGPDDFVPARFEDPVVRGLMERVVGMRDPSLDARFPRTWPCWVRIRRRGLPPLEARVDHPHGDPESFLTAAELDAKFRALAARVLGVSAIDRLAAALDGFARAPSARLLLDAAVPSVS
jgi:2-methylcitrate dehydratase PrpD